MRTLAIVLMLLLAGQVQAGLAMRGLAAVRANMSSIPRDGLVAEYLFDTDARDTSGNGNDGTVYGSITIDGYAESGGSITNYVLVDNDSSINFGTNDYSISVWVRVANLTGQIMAKRYENGPNVGFVMYLSSGYARILIQDNSGLVYATSTTPVNDNEWHHILAVIEDNTPVIYVDSDYENSGSTLSGTKNISNTSDLYIFRQGFASDVGFDGDIDSLRYYSRAITNSSEILQLYKEVRD